MLHKKTKCMDLHVRKVQRLCFQLFAIHPVRTEVSVRGTTFAPVLKATQGKGAKKVSE